MLNPYADLEFLTPYAFSTKPIVLAIFSAVSVEAIALVKRLTAKKIGATVIFASLDSYTQLRSVADYFPGAIFAVDYNYRLRTFIELNESKIADVFHCFILVDYKLVWKGGYPSTDFDYWVARVACDEIEAFRTPESRPLGPYSPGMSASGFLFLSGQLGMHNGRLQDGVEAQTRAALGNAEKLLKTQRSDLSKVCKTTVMLQRMEDFAAMNRAYAEAFKGHKPARICVEMAALPAHALVEIDLIAVAK